MSGVSGLPSNTWNWSSTEPRRHGGDRFRNNLLPGLRRPGLAPPRWAIPALLRCPDHLRPRPARWKRDITSVCVDEILTLTLKRPGSCRVSRDQAATRCPLELCHSLVLLNWNSVLVSGWVPYLSLETTLLPSIRPQQAPHSCVPAPAARGLSLAHAVTSTTEQGQPG